MTLTSGFLPFKDLLVPLTVPQVPRETNRWVIFPSVCRQISGPVVRTCARTFWSFSYWLGIAYFFACALAWDLAILIEPSPRPGAGQRASLTTSRSAPVIFNRTFFSSGTLLGTTTRM